MGIVRIIREKLKSNHKYFIVEMGAYGVGSINRLCKLVPPLHGIITAVGVAHLEQIKKPKMLLKLNLTFKLCRRQFRMYNPEFRSD